MASPIFFVGKRKPRIRNIEKWAPKIKRGKKKRVRRQRRKMNTETQRTRLPAGRQGVTRRKKNLGRGLKSELSHPEEVPAGKGCFRPKY
jgi:hypothetical protein